MVQASETGWRALARTKWALRLIAGEVRSGMPLLQDEMRGVKSAGHLNTWSGEDNKK